MFRIALLALVISISAYAQENCSYIPKSLEEAYKCGWHDLDSTRGRRLKAVAELHDKAAVSSKTSLDFDRSSLDK